MMREKDVDDMGECLSIFLAGRGTDGWTDKEITPMRMETQICGGDRPSRERGGVNRREGRDSGQMRGKGYSSCRPSGWHVFGMCQGRKWSCS